MLNTFEPITLPIAISVSPFLIATIDVTNSGKDVPTATIVKPTKLALMPRVVAIFVAESTTISPPNIIPAIPITLNNIVFGTENSTTFSTSAVMAASSSPSRALFLAFLTVFIKK